MMLHPPKYLFSGTGKTVQIEINVPLKHTVQGLLTHCGRVKPSCLGHQSPSLSSHCCKHLYYGLSEVNSLAPGRSECDSSNVIFNLVLLIGIFRSSHDNALRWMPQDLTEDKLTLVQVMAWCHQATSHYLSQCWLSSLSPYGVASPQWVK